MGNSINPSSSPIQKPKPIDTTFKLPSPLPTWPSGEKFASGTIDLGGLEVCQISSFTKIWAIHEGGPENQGATFFEPSPMPNGFSMLGSYAQPNNKALFGWVLAGKDLTGGALKHPIDYTLVWSSESLKIKQDGKGFIWLPIPSNGYKAIGYVVTNSPGKPPLDKIRCVREDFIEECEIDSWIWGENTEVDEKGFNLYGLRPKHRGMNALGVSSGTFIAQNGGSVNSIACLKNVKNNLSTMPNSRQIQALMQAYSPWIYFHPDEDYLPASVSWFFKNGALLYKKENESNPVSIEPTGSNLPRDGSNDGAYWLDLPLDKKAKKLVMKGYLQDAQVYLHVKPMLGATFTDIAMWVFYPFNGPARAKVGLINIPLGEIGEHVGDWEHVTLRVSNFNGELKSVYFSQHSGGIWVSVSELGNKAVTYSSLSGHAFYPKAGLVLQGGGGIGIRNDTAKNGTFMDTGLKFSIFAAEYLGSEIVEPPWLNYARKWGPKIEYDSADVVETVEKLVPENLKTDFENFVRSLPDEILGEDGPTGPKMKNSWSGDEKV